MKRKAVYSLGEIFKFSTDNVLNMCVRVVTFLTRTMEPISLEALAAGTRVLGGEVKTRSISMTCMSF